MQRIRTVLATLGVATLASSMVVISSTDAAAGNRGSSIGSSHPSHRGPFKSRQARRAAAAAVNMGLSRYLDAGYTPVRTLDEVHRGLGDQVALRMHNSLNRWAGARTDSANGTVIVARRDPHTHHVIQEVYRVTGTWRITREKPGPWGGSRVSLLGVPEYFWVNVHGADGEVGPDPADPPRGFQAALWREEIVTAQSPSAGLVDGAGDIGPSAVGHGATG